ncbi:uncharacterized protein K02A2.6-like [Vanessa cardui]|uniref:uncharacterized protein K02A2.6-like n=1 Tax=Vanessa cardui TaxID=171605 RepID=UPI001F12DB1B|nr:uncharacterized protein K02A2.6-like [Vanessa cardui]
MSGAHFGILNGFDHNINTWRTYKGRILQYFVANDINEQTDATGRKRKAILLSALSEGTYKLASDLVLPKDIEDVPYEDVIKSLDSHFIPKRVGFGERHAFYTASQLPGETHSQWAARLRGLTAHCGFLNVEEALRDRFIIGMRSGIEKEKLYSQDLTNLTLARAVELAENLSCAQAAAAASATSSGVVAMAAGLPGPDTQLYKMSQGEKKRGVAKDKCKVCGYTNHKSSECKYANYQCKKCHMKGHLRRMCSKVNYVEVDSGDQGEDDDDDGNLYFIRSVRGEPMVETIKIFNVPYKFEIDSGSAVTVISESYYKNNFKDVPLSTTQKQLRTYNGKNIFCVGIIHVPVTYASQTHIIAIYVVRSGGPPLLGRNFISKFNLQLVPVNYHSIENESFITDLQQKYSSLFSDKLGTFNKYKIKLSLRDNVKPVFFKARPIAFALRDKVIKEIDRLVSLGILEPVEYSEYASPIVPVLKRDGSVRLCADYSVSINKQLLVEQYPLPTTNELFSKIHGGAQFSKLDLSMAYNQFTLDDESKNLTCINTSRGLYRFTRLVFGLASAPAIFQRAIEGVLSGIEGVLCLLDDILITGRDKAEHLERLHVVLSRLQNAGLTLQKEKCTFFQDEVTYLGFIISKDGLKKAPEKIKAMIEAPVPTNVNQLQSFLGLINYYRNFVPNISSILCPLYDLLKKGCTWNWTKIHDRAFETIKKLMTSEQVLAHFDPQAKLILTVDASPNGLGAILSQIGSDNVERPISFASRTLSSAEKRYSQIQKEATAIIYGVRRFHQYLYGRSLPFILRTDHKPLLSIFGPYKGVPEMSANRLQRYALFLSGYNYKIEYIRSSDNSADYLSRASLPDSSLAQMSEECGEDESCDRATYVYFVTDDSMPVTLDKLRMETKDDDVLKRVINYIINGWPRKLSDSKLKPYHLCKSQLSYESGCVMRGHKVVLPCSLYETILNELHSSHLGIVKTKAEARSRFWFPGIDKAIETLIGSCEVCIQMRPSPPRAPPAHWKFPVYPFHRLHIDYLGPIKGWVYLVIVDAHTKWVEVYDMKTSTTSTAVILKICDFISRFGLPSIIVSDNGTAFCSREFELFCSSNSITHLTSPMYHPPSNGQAESFVKIVKRGLKSCLLSTQTMKDSKLKLLKYLMDYRNSVHTTTGLSPAEMVFGHKIRSRLDLLNPKWSIPSSPLISDLLKNQQCSQSDAQLKLKTNNFTINDIVLYKKNINNKNFTWCKGIVIKRLGKVVYLVKDIETLSCYKKHINQLMLYKGICNNHWDSVQLTHTSMPDLSTQTQTQPVASPAQVQMSPPQATISSRASSPRLSTSSPFENQNGVTPLEASLHDSSPEIKSRRLNKGKRVEFYEPETFPSSDDEFHEAENERESRLDP